MYCASGCRLVWDLVFEDPSERHDAIENLPGAAPSWPAVSQAPSGDSSLAGGYLQEPTLSWLVFGNSALIASPPSSILLSLSWSAWSLASSSTKTFAAMVPAWDGDSGLESSGGSSGH